MVHCVRIVMNLAPPVLAQHIKIANLAIQDIGSILQKVARKNVKKMKFGFTQTTVRSVIQSVIVAKISQEHAK